MAKLLDNITLSDVGSSPVDNFDYSSSYEWYALKQYFSSGVNLAELTSIAQILVGLLNLPSLSRNTKRTFQSLLLWYHENWNEIVNILPYIVLYDDSCKPINSSTEFETKYQNLMKVKQKRN